MATVTAFCRQHAPKGIGTWDEAVLRRWLTARAAAGELHLVTLGDEIKALGAASENEDGSITINAVIGPRWLWPSMFRTFRSRWPDWRNRLIKAVRRGRERYYTSHQLFRVINGTS